MSAQDADDVLPDGSLMILQQHPTATANLVITERVKDIDPPRYGAYYIQFPERGIQCGGSSWAWRRDQFRHPETAEELLKAQLYRTAKRVLDLQAELAEAEKDAEAVRRYAALTDGEAS